MATSRRKPRAHGEITRGRLLEVAGRLFAQRGYAGVAGKAICEAAGTDLAAINYHFGGREELYRAVLLEGYGQFVSLDLLMEIHARKCPARDKLGAIIDLIVDRLLDKRGWHGRVFARELLAPSSHFASLVREGVMPRFRLLSDVLSELTGIPVGDPALLRCLASVMAPCLMMLVVDRATPSPLRTLLRQPADDLKTHLRQFSLAGLEAVRASVDTDAPVRAADRR